MIFLLFFWPIRIVLGVNNLSAANFTVSILQTGRNNAREVTAAPAVTGHCVGILYVYLYIYIYTYIIIIYNTHSSNNNNKNNNNDDDGCVTV